VEDHSSEIRSNSDGSIATVKKKQRKSNKKKPVQKEQSKPELTTTQA
jgi:hypothetical protein